MPENLAVYLFFGLFLGIIVGILSVILGKYLKGEIKIKLIKRNFNFGETITGLFTLHAKKTINGDDLSVHLVAYRRESSYDKDGRRNTRRVEVARYSQILESGKIYDAGLKRDFDFKIQIPTEQEIRGDRTKLGKDLSNMLGGGRLGKLAKYAFTHMPRAKISWQVQVDLEATGLDIHGKKDIFIQSQT